MKRFFLKKEGLTVTVFLLESASFFERLIGHSVETLKDVFFEAVPFA